MALKSRIARLRSARGRHAHGHEHQGYMPGPPWAYPPVPMTPSEWQYKPPMPVGGITFPNPELYNPAIEPYVSQAMYSPFSGYGFVPPNPGVRAMRAKDRRLMGSANIPPTMSGPLARNQIANAAMQTPGQFHEHAMMAPPHIDDEWWSDGDDLDLMDEEMGMDSIYGDMEEMSEDLLGLDADDYETMAAARRYLRTHTFGEDATSSDKKSQRRDKRKLFWSNLFKRQEGDKTKAEQAADTAKNVSTELQQMQEAIDKLIFPQKAAQRKADRASRLLARADDILERRGYVGPDAPVGPARTGMSPWAIAGIAVGSAALVGGGVYFAMRKK